MRKTFESQMVLGSATIEQAQIPTRSRDEFPPFLRAMQHIFTTKDLREQVFRLLENAICTKKPTGRPGMDLWTIFVLAGARLCLNTDYDRLHYMSNEDNLLRQILGVQDGFVRGRSFELQTIKDNVSLLDDNTLREINIIVAGAGHNLKKKETEALHIKVDSFVTEASVHFPTDYNLLWDSGRKCLDVLEHLMDSDTSYCTGWRKLEYWRKSMKNKMLVLSRATADRSKNRDERIENAAREYLFASRSLYNKLITVKPLNPLDLVQESMISQLDYYRSMLEKHIDLVERRLLKDEKIPHDEKLFSIFEPWVEWICKGKAYKPVELGKRTCIASDQWHFIVDWWVADHQQDNQLLLPVIDRIRQHFSVAGCSGDKGFFSKIDVEIMKLFDINVIIPKKGKRSVSDIKRESEPSFIKGRHKHSAVESNINELEHRGLDRCPDRGIKGMQRYVGLAVIAYNLRRLGKILMEKDIKSCFTAHGKAA